MLTDDERREMDVLACVACGGPVTRHELARTCGKQCWVPVVDAGYLCSEYEPPAPPMYPRGETYYTRTKAGVARLAELRKREATNDAD